MKVIRSEGAMKLSVVCCVHGDEPFGKRVFDYYSSRMAQMPGCQLILANEEALEKGERFVDTDLNRCFPGKPDGNREEQLADNIFELIKGSEYVIDVHTTTSDVVMTPIVASLNRNVRHIVNLTNSREVALMSSEIARRALIGNVKAGVSLEFNEEYAKTAQALEEVCLVVNGLLNGVEREKLARKVFCINRVIPLDAQLPSDAINFSFIETLGVYPFLLGEKAYTDFQGFAAKEIKSVLI